ncbi:MAG: tetratricopeptide repeat protein, partial [Burkholderiales bacterium]
MQTSPFDTVLRDAQQRRAASDAAAALEVGNTTVALKLLEPAHRAAPGDAQVAMRLGQTLLERDQIARGIELLDQAVR